MVTPEVRVLTLYDRRRLAAVAADQAARATAELVDDRADLAQSGAQLLVADLDRAHRVLLLGDRLVGVGDVVRGGLDEPGDGRGRRGCRRRQEAAARQAGALREAGVGALRAPVRRLHRAEELLLESVGGVLVELVVRHAERGQRRAELADRLGERVEHFLPGLDRAVGHDGGGGNRTPNSALQTPRVPVSTTPPEQSKV